MTDVFSWPWQHLPLSPTAKLLLSRWDLQFQSSITLTSIWEHGERARGLLATWHLSVRKAQRADAKKDVVSRGLGSVGLQFSRAHCGLNVLLQLTLHHWAKYLSLAQRAWATFLCSALTYLEGLYTSLLTNESDCCLCPIAWYSQEKWVCLLTSMWYLLSPSLMSVYLLTHIFCRWFGYNLLAGTRSFPVQPILQKLSHVAGVLSSWILALIDSSRSEVTWFCLCYVIMQLCCFKAKLLSGKRSPSQACSYRPSLPGNWSLWWKGVGTRFFTKSWNNEKARESLYIRYLLKVLFLSWDYPKTWFCFTYILKKCGVWGF